VPRSAANEREHAGGAVEIDYCLRLSGELVQGSVGQFEKAIRAALKASPREIVVDLTGVDSIDETGLTALLKAHLRSRQLGLRIRFVPSDHEAVRQVVTVTGTEEIAD
jgi:anti-anti-sigma factor